MLILKKEYLLLIQNPHLTGHPVFYQASVIPALSLALAAIPFSGALCSQIIVIWLSFLRHPNHRANITSSEKHSLLIQSIWLPTHTSPWPSHYFISFFFFPFWHISSIKAGTLSILFTFVSPLPVTVLGI